MDKQTQKTRDREDKQEELQSFEGKRNIVQQNKLHQPQQKPASPPSSSSSPNHEFSFTISLHPQSAKIPDNNKNKSPPSFAIDLSPADEIFFHGHLLPLHLLSHLPVSPRSSTNSLDSFTLPIKELLKENNTNSIEEDSSDQYPSFHRTDDDFEEKPRRKSKSFSLFGRWRKGYEPKDEQNPKRKLKFDLVKKYMKMIRPFLSFRSRRMNSDFRTKPFSLSGNLRVRSKKELRGRRGEYSAPVSMRTSPSNSGLLVATGTSTPTANDSTMEELQAAIQAAIAHCKKSIATHEDKMVQSHD